LPTYSPDSPTGSVCGGPVGTEIRKHGSSGNRRALPHYACLDHKRRGAAVCTNGIVLRQDILDRAILAAITETLDPRVLEVAVEKVFARLTAHRERHASRQAQIEQELQAAQQKLDRLPPHHRE
jgi:hypothetical protein